MVGNTLGHYKVIEKLGSGGMGDVYIAEDLTLGRKVALKVLPSDLANDPDRRDRFVREARAVAALSHPNVLAIHDFGEDRGIAFAVTELLEGQTLRRRLDEGSLSPVEAMEFARQMADGLAAAHARGIVHRDLKPENLFVTSNSKIKILDFGLAKKAEEGGGEETPTPNAGNRAGDDHGDGRLHGSGTSARSIPPIIARMFSRSVPSCTRCCQAKELFVANRRR